MLKPPIARMGGKSKLRKQIISMITEHTCYCEVFFGAGWVYFGKEPSKAEIINDVDGELINLFRMIKYHAEEVQRLMQYEVCSRDIFEQYKNINHGSLTEIQRAIRFIYLISQSFASKGDNFGYKTKGKPSPHIFDTDKLSAIKARLRNTIIENQSFEEIFRRYDRSYTLFFCDPPYYETAGYKHKFTKEDHLKLLEILKNIKGKFLLTINDHPEVREWYKDYNIKEVQVGYSVGKEKASRKKYGELIITNY